MTTEKSLRFENVVKTFGGTRALKGVSLDVHRGEVVALLGENGAGKSTLIKILGGIFKADSGQITIGGEPYRHRAHARGERQSVAFIHQDLGLVEWMTVAENMSLPQGFAGRGWSGALGLIDWRKAEQQALTALKLVGCDIDPTTRVHSLSRTEKSLVAIARALVVDCDFLVLDEPTASLPADEVERLFDAVRRLRARGVGMIYVSHRLDEIFRIADRVVVMRDGLKVGEKAVNETTPDELVSLIVGRSTLDLFRKAEYQPGPVRVALRDVVTPSAGPVSFEVRQGELLGLVGLRGAGQEEIGRALFGSAPHRGSITLDGEAPDLSSPRAALKAGIGLIARDRMEESLAPSLSIRENAFLNPGAAGRGLLSPLSPSAEARQADETRANPWDCGPTIPICRSRACRAATSRRWWSAAGSSPGAVCWWPKIPPPASTSAPRRRSTGSSRARSRRGSRSSWSPPTSRRSRTSAIGRWCSTGAGSSRSSPAPRSPPKRSSPRPPLQKRLERKKGDVMSTNSIKSDALEPTRAELKDASAAEKLLRRLPVYGLPILTVVSDRAVLR